MTSIPESSAPATVATFTSPDWAAGHLTADCGVTWTLRTSVEVIELTEIGSAPMIVELSQDDFLQVAENRSVAVERHPAQITIGRQIAIEPAAVPSLVAALTELHEAWLSTNQSQLERALTDDDIYQQDGSISLPAGDYDPAELAALRQRCIVNITESQA